MADLVADHCADAAIIRRILGLGSKNGAAESRTGNTMTFMLGS